MIEYLTTETVTYAYDASGRLSKKTTITTEGPDDQEPPVSARAEDFLKDASGSVIVDMEDWRVHRSGHRWSPAKPQQGLMHDEYPE